MAPDWAHAAATGGDVLSPNKYWPRKLQSRYDIDH
jgi:hypothetical protein